MGLQPAQHGQHPEPAGLLAARVVQRERRGQDPSQHRGSARLGRRPRRRDRARRERSQQSRPGRLHQPARRRPGIGGRAVITCSLPVVTTRVLAEQDPQALGPIPRRRRRRRVAVALPGVEGEHAGDHVLGHRVQVALGSRQVRVAQDPLHVSQRHLRIAGHPIRRGVPKIVQRPVRPQRGVGAGEHRPGRVVAQRAERAPQRPPQRLVAAGWHQTGHLRLIEPQPDERVRRGRQRLQRPGSLAHHGDQLLPRVGVGNRGAQQLRGPRTGRDPQRHQRPVTVRTQLREQRVEPLVRDGPRRPRHHLRPIPAAALTDERLHRVVMRCARPARRCRDSGNGLSIGPVPASRWKS